MINRDLYQELRSIGLTHDHVSDVLGWVDTLPIQIIGVSDTKAWIENGTFKIESNKQRTFSVRDWKKAIHTIESGGLGSGVRLKETHQHHYTIEFNTGLDSCDIEKRLGDNYLSMSDITNLIVDSLTEEEKADLKKNWEDGLVKREDVNERMRKYLYNISNDKFTEFMVKLFVWEKKYETMMYGRGMLSTSNILGSIIGMSSRFGKSIYDEETEDIFLTNRYLYKGFVFETHSGQGVIHKIYKFDDEKIHFTTT
jgi:hypothetical protein